MIEYKEKYQFAGWKNCLYLSNGRIEMVITTDVGPRVIRLGYKNKQNLFREFEDQVGKIGGDDYRLYGGTRFWHGPEENPRCYYPDNVPVKYEWDGKTVRLLQDVEATTGMQKEIFITMDPNKDNAGIRYRIHNKNLWDIKFAPWILTIMNLGGRAVVPHEPFQTWEDNYSPVRPLVLWAYTTMDDPRWIWGKKYIQLKQDREANTRQKLGILNKLGWIAYSLGEDLFIKRFNFEKDVEYADYGVNSEIYTDNDIFEVETLGRFAPVKPGGYAEHAENWNVFKSEINEKEASIDSILLPLLESTDLP
jgi:hypothetical protein